MPGLEPETDNLKSPDPASNPVSSAEYRLDSSRQKYIRFLENIYKDKTSFWFGGSSGSFAETRKMILAK